MKLNLILKEVRFGLLTYYLNTNQIIKSFTLKNYIKEARKINEVE